MVCDDVLAFHNDPLRRRAVFKEECREVRGEADQSCRSELAAERWVRVMCDYGADGVWAKGGFAVHPADLPISDDLAVRILEWQYRHDNWRTLQDNAEHPVYIEDAPPDVLEPFAGEGFLIALVVRRQLPDWTVVYRDERRRVPYERVGFTDEVRAHYRQWSQYEITDAVLATGTPPDNHPGDYGAGIT
ncbi:hypothetical protein [Paracoccus luteus]|uniref:hypothetical protein n=1 Tax=Paracoccus luteus TaxID=2508543 RepID=UPI00106F3A06|nr:hypothetical protein [Paracoccus luteus]